MLLDVTFRLLIAMLLGGIIGIEREYRSKEAGFRTHFLVALGSALFCVVSQYGFGEEIKDASRIAAQVVSGIGFLGAGTIIFQKNMVRGLTTAAGLWVTAAIGLACGTGMFAVAGIATGLIIIGLEVIIAFLPQIGTTTISISFSAASRESIVQVMEKIKGDGAEIHSYAFRERHSSHGLVYETTLELKIKKGEADERLIGYMAEFQDVTISSMEL